MISPFLWERLYKDYKFYSLEISNPKKKDLIVLIFFPTSRWSAMATWALLGSPRSIIPPATSFLFYLM
jgi:hypothetical protein